MKKDQIFTRIYELLGTLTDDEARAIDLLYLYKEIRLQIEDKLFSDEFIKKLYDCFEDMQQLGFDTCIDDFVNLLDMKVQTKQQKLEELDLEEIKKEFAGE